MFFLPTSASLMSKRRNNDTSKDDTQATGKRARKPTAGFRVARPPAAQSTSQSTVAVPTSSRITTLALGPKGRRASKRKDKSRPAPPPNRRLQLYQARLNCWKTLTRRLPLIRNWKSSQSPNERETTKLRYAISWQLSMTFVSDYNSY